MEEIRGLIVVFSVLLGAIVFFNGLLFQNHVENDSKKISTAILIVTCASFLITNFWVFILLLLVLCSILIRSGLEISTGFLVLFCVAPFIGVIVPGFGLVNQLILVTPLFSLCIFIIPKLFEFNSFTFKFNGKIDKYDFFLYSFVLILILLSFRSESITNGMREATIRSILVLVPYLLFSRMVGTVEQLVKVTYAYVFVMFCFSCVAVVETAWGWHFYASILHNWEDSRVRSQYLERAGYLRAFTSVYGPIALGYMIALATGFCLSIKSRVGSTGRVLIILVVLLAGVAATLSRGPLLGAFAIIFLFLLLKTAFGGRFSKFILPAGIVGILAIGSGQIARLVEMLPVIGSVETETVEYRTELMNSALELIWRYPMFGSEGFRSDLAEKGLVQGQGIVDVVNTYLSILLNFGFVGLGSFVLFWISVASGLQKALSKTYYDRPELHSMCAGFLATLCGSLLIIATTSSVRHVPGIYWTLAGLCVALIRVVSENNSEKRLAVLH